MRDEAGGRAPLGIRRRTYGLRNRGIPRFAILHSGSARPPFGSRPSPRSARRQRPFLAGLGPSSPSWSTGLVARPGSGGRPRGVGFGTPEGGRRTHRRIEWSDRLSRWWAGIPRTVGTASTCASPQRTIGSNRAWTIKVCAASRQRQAQIRVWSGSSQVTRSPTPLPAGTMARDGMTFQCRARPSRVPDSREPFWSLVSRWPAARD